MFSFVNLVLFILLFVFFKFLDLVNKDTYIHTWHPNCSELVRFLHFVVCIPLTKMLKPSFLLLVAQQMLLKRAKTFLSETNFSERIDRALAEKHYSDNLPTDRIHDCWCLKANNATVRACSL